MMPLLQKENLRKNGKTQASDFEKTWELWMLYSCEFCSAGASMQVDQKWKAFLEVETSGNISLSNSLESSGGQ